jgi:hypothetical protein
MEISKLKSYIRSIYGRVSISVWAPVQFNHAHWFDSEVDEKSFWLRLPSYYFVKYCFPEGGFCTRNPLVFLFYLYFLCSFQGHLRHCQFNLGFLYILLLLLLSSSSLCICCMQDIYTYVLETNHVSR